MAKKRLAPKKAKVPARKKAKAPVRAGKKKTPPKTKGRKTVARNRSKKASNKRPPLPADLALVRVSPPEAAPQHPELPTVAEGALAARPTHGVAAHGLSRVKLTKRQMRLLMKPFDDQHTAVLPTGETYIPNVWLRRRLNTAFGPLAWGLNPLSQEQFQKERKLVIQSWELLVEGLSGGVTTGECGWQEANSRMTWGDAVEGAKSNALARLLKDLSVGDDVRDQDWAYQFRLRCCVLVKCMTGYGDRKKEKAQWRKFTSQPLQGEQGIDPRSPNKDKYQAPDAPQRAAAGRRRAPTPEDSADMRDGQRQAETRQITHGPGTILPAAIGQLQKLCDTHQISEEVFKAYLYGEFGHKSRTQILKSQWNDITNWIKGGGAKAIQGEVVEGPPGPELTSDDMNWGDK